MADRTTAHDGRLWDPEAEAPRNARTPPEHSEQHHTAPGNTASLAHAIGTPGNRTITQRLDTIEQRLHTIHNLLTALTHAHDIAPETTN